MPQYNRRELDAKSREYGFNRDTFEKLTALRFVARRIKSGINGRLFSTGVPL